MSRSVVSVVHLGKVWTNLVNIKVRGYAVKDVTKLINFIESEIEAAVGDNMYRWVHDKVQKAALSLMQVDEMSLKFDLGKAMYYNLQGKELEDGLLDVVGLITIGDTAAKSVDFASLCHDESTKKHAKKIRKTIQKWKKAEIPNVVYYCTFLGAEDVALHGKLFLADYKEAIQFVANSGYHQHEGLFSELYSDYLLRERGDNNEAKYRLKSDWGALRKVEKPTESNILQSEVA
ncbi:MAG: hypothetical protein SGBAC_006392 [Bacillariaceae sp.]